MKLLTHFKNLNLTQDQKNALEKLSRFFESDDSIFILQGYAGSGKTTLLKGVVEYLKSTKKNLQLMAPTGRAAKILRDKTDDGKTIHSVIYNLKKLETLNAGSDEVADHSIKYSFPIDLNNKNEQVLIIDEASMISSRESKNELFDFGTNVLLDDLLNYAFSSNKNNKIIFVGDPAQLAPVGDNNSYALDLEYFKNLGYSVQMEVLTEIKRQENNLILKNATQIRDVLNAEHRNELKLEFDDKSYIELTNIDIIDKFINAYPQPELGDGVIISFSNAQCYHYNYAIREALYPNERDILSGDLVLINNNNYHTYSTELYNGDIAKVIDVDKNTETLSAPVWAVKNGKKVRVTISLNFRQITIRIPNYDGEIKCYIIETLLNSIDRDLTIEMTKALYINFVMRFNEEQDRRKESGLQIHKVGSEEFKQALKSDPYYNALRVKYGYAITCHKAQGGEWDKVFVDYSGRIGLYNDALRWCYTATTRAVNTLYAINPPQFTNFSKLKFSEVVSVNNIPKNALSLTHVNTSPFHNSEHHKGKSLKFWEIKEALEEESFEITNVETSGYLERYTVIDSQNIKYFIQASHKESGHFIDTFKIQNSSNTPLEEELEKVFNTKKNSTYYVNYKPSLNHLEILHSVMRESCAELDISITNIEEQLDKYYVTYYLRTDSIFSYIQFYFKGNGNFSTAMPKTFQSENDLKLNSLIKKLTNYAI
ncbi:ATP-dependent DNA helicase [Maribacter ulvicola]|uniref:UvrD-like helicase C-terminal domain-containing protein n=1 Tax=Maribacter ulvicola TaxID=228959 RepID=A0A1N6WRH6_9FLAO|nr:AAA family ATPase [Maribacter ulvicola]SIQ92648.1 UvrD-like helicase C-terminal domain-containing protein [Maribacter ulvicola]